MNSYRRTLLSTLVATRFTRAIAWLCAMGAMPAFALEWNKAAFDAKTYPEALKSFGIASPEQTEDIMIRAPDIAENGAAVPIEIVSRIPGTRRITVFAEKNPQPLVASFEFGDDVEPYVSTRIKIGESSMVYVVANANGKDFFAGKDVKVTIGGCG
jgi:sulfur-oxidizing protein SoxY